MNSITDRTSSSAVVAVYNTLGIAPPKALTDAVKRADTLAAHVNEIGARDGDLEAAVTAAVLAGVDPASDPVVQRIIIALALASNHGLVDAVVAPGSRRSAPPASTTSTRSSAPGPRSSTRLPPRSPPPTSASAITGSTTPAQSWPRVATSPSSGLAPGMQTTPSS